MEKYVKKDKYEGMFNLTVWLPEPYELKIKIYQDLEGIYSGQTFLLLKDAEDGDAFSGIVGLGRSIDDALRDTVKYFFIEIDKNYPTSLSKDSVSFAEISDF